jgi:hypothetical protein
LKSVENLGIAEEIGHANQEVPEKRVHFGPRELQITQILVQPINLMDGHTPLDAAHDGASFVLGKVMAGLGAEQEKYFLQRARRMMRRRRCGSRKRMAGIGQELGRHFVRRQHEIHHPGSDSAAGHAVVLSGFGCLHHHHAALALHRPDAQAAVATGAREHNADGSFALVLGQGTEEKIDREPDAAGRTGFQQVQRAVRKLHIAIGRDDIRAVRLITMPSSTSKTCILV